MLISLRIEKMYGWRNFDIKFYRDLTLLVGLNGSGKTSVLNIISSIAAGNLDFLQKFECEKVILEYDRNGSIFLLKIIKIEEDSYTLSLNENEYNFNTHTLSTKDKKNWMNSDLEKIMKKISNDLNLLYLPLSRDTRSPFDADMIKDVRPEFIEKNIYYSTFEVNRNLSSMSSIDDTLSTIDRLIKEYQRKTILHFEHLNNKMRRDMFQSSFVYYSDYARSDGVQNHFESLTDSKIIELKSAFMEMKLLTPGFENSIDNFIKKLKIGLELYLKWQNEEIEFSDEVGDFISNISQVDRIIKWLSIVQETNNKKDQLHNNEKNFLDTVNEFLIESDKELGFNDAEGKLYFKLRNYDSKKRLPLDKLSSGEKQIVIFFAYLIFEVSTKRRGIFIIDEPEISLHVSWQRLFARSILNAAPNLQLIFATHSPEIVGVSREKCIALGSESN